MTKTLRKIPILSFMKIAVGNFYLRNLEFGIISGKNE